MKRNHRRHGAPALVLPSTVAALATIVVATVYPQSSAIAAPVQPSIGFTAEAPPPPASLPVFALRNTAAPRALIERGLHAHRASGLRTEKNLTVARDVDTKLIRAFIEPKSGEAIVVPDLARATPVSHNVRPLVVARTIFSQGELLPHDVTTYQLGNEIPVVGAAVERPASAGKAPAIVAAPAVRYTFVAARRFASGFPVYGSGSHASVAIAPNGELSGVLRRWKSASRIANIPVRFDRAAVKAAIVKQLQPFTKDTAITVDTVKIAYYDGNAGYMQPTYRFTAVLHPLEGHVGDQRVAGYVPIGQPREAIPALQDMRSQTKVETPVRLEALKLQRLRSLQTGGTASRITLGEYANRDTTLNGMADEFYRGLTMHIPFLPSFGPPIVRTQYYYAYPWEVVGANSRAFMNSVNIAYTQPHGDWYINTTYSNYADLWDVRDIGVKGNPGFGAAAGGKLATWIVDSCEVVPAFYDLSVTTGNGYNAFTPWFPVFQGLHNVIGFRTQMWLYDGLNVPFGFAAQLGGDVNSAWFQEIAADPAYNDGYTYLDTHLNQNVHMGRASTFIDARDLGHSIYDVAPQSASTRLWNFWMAN